MLKSLEAIAKTSVLVVLPHFDTAVLAMDTYGLTENGLSLVGLLGRSNAETAEKAMQTLVRWSGDKYDSNSLDQALLNEMSKIGRVYKQTLSAHQNLFEKLRTHPNKTVSKSASELLQFYKSKETCDPDYLPTKQEDECGRPLTTSHSQKATASSERMTNDDVAEITRRADHPREKAHTQLLAHPVPVDSINVSIQRTNAVELALRDSQDCQPKEDEETLSRISSRLQERQEDCTSFLKELISCIPIPSTVDTKGRVKKRLVLRFQCSYGSKPEWAKWIRLLSVMLATGKSIRILGRTGSFSSLFEAYKVVRSQNEDHRMTFRSLLTRPFLAPSEQREVIEALREEGFYYEFRYDASNSTWHRHFVPDSLRKGSEEPTHSTTSGRDKMTQSTHPMLQNMRETENSQQSPGNSQTITTATSEGSSIIEGLLKSSSKEEAEKKALQSWSLLNQDISKFGRALPGLLEGFLSADPRYCYCNLCSLRTGRTMLHRKYMQFAS